ncbi:hypothetical protein ASPACDRAFT_43793 [Aspergillus aculeatus ATCC 16872]|uniref:Uncharacterized protein n=1 Tax=Aspergillus aculeatus (strain ATCC 16872 / CBS 172.66 / WB 5094) TaxID=690307 RepID=A0A1L9WSP7_ASPA1|nr:uncharacterized protein ASPACDRAFT_43793 [Aspergillus aculeatus ATCC 16872]OJJ99132.1 hypothetical protein ASPACDRAFT_43793 [Aspergillus aculeatus ATCC 16872]
MDVPPILRLPTEILTCIFENVASSYYETCRVLRKFTLVCRRLAQIVLPLLYRDVLVRVAAGRALETLFAVLQKRPLYRENVRELVIQMDDYIDIHRRNFYITCDIITCVTNVRALTFCGGWERYPDQTWGLVHRASRSMPALESLSLSRMGTGLTVRDILDTLQMPSLRQLKLDGIAFQTGGRTASAERRANRPSCLPNITKGTAQFSTLHIQDYQDTSAATQELILWPKALIHFHAVLLRGSSPEFEIDLSMLSTWLFAHKDTLQTIHIGYIDNLHPGKLFQTRGFVALERLTLPWWQVQGYVRWQQEDEGDLPFVFMPAHADALLCAPRLTTLELGYGLSPYGVDSCDTFGEVEARWIRELAHAAQARQAALRMIRVGYMPEPCCLEEVLEYPWDRLIQLREDLRPLGIRLEWDEPSFSEEEWIQARMQASPPWGAMRGSESPPLDDGMLFDCGLSKDGEPSVEEQEAWEYAHKAIR